MIGMMQEHTLHDYVQLMVENYLQQLGNEKPSKVYDMVVSEVEKALFKSMMRYAKQNQSKASEYLGINRGTLRKKLKEYGLNDDSH